jgi:hypothetical protein
MVYTDAGNALSAKLETGVQLVITRVVSGAGRSADLTALTDLPNPKQELEITGITEQQGPYYTIYVRLSNQGLTAAYDLTQIGVYAQDPDAGEILYRVAQLDLAIPIPAEADFPDYSIASQIIGVKSNASTITADIKPTGMVTYQQFVDALANLTPVIVSPAEPANQAVGGLWLDTSDGPSGMGGGLVIANAVVSPTQPPENPPLWFQTFD